MNKTNTQNINGAAPQAPANDPAPAPASIKAEQKPAAAATTKKPDAPTPAAPAIKHPEAAAPVTGKKPS